MSQALSYDLVNWSFEPDTMAEKGGGVMLKFAKTKAKTSFTNLRRPLLVAIDEDDVSKNDIKFRLVTLENAMNEVMELISEIVLESREDEAALYNISEEAGELEKQYTDAVTRASTVLAELSNYNSARTSEVTGVRYTRDPEKVRAYLASVSQAVRTVAQPGQTYSNWMHFHAQPMTLHRTPL